MPVEGFRYAIPYVLLVIYYILLVITEYLINKQDIKYVVNKQVIRWASISGLLIFFGFRGFIGWDWYLYFPLFNDIPSSFNFKTDLFASTDFDHGFVFYLATIKSIWNNYHFLIFINTLLDLLILNLIIRRYSDHSYSLACLLFIIMGGFYLETDLLRNAKSIMFFLLSIKYIQERRIGPYYLLNIVGCLFHISSVLYLPLYFILNKKIPRKVVIAIFIIGLIIFSMQVEYVRPFLGWVAALLGHRFTLLLERYLQISMYSNEYGITIGLLERTITFSLLIIYYEKLIIKNSYNLLFINSYIIYFIFFFFFAEIKIIPVRVGGLFAFSYWILYPELAKVFKHRNNKSIFLSSFFLYSLIKIAGMTDNILYSYINVLFGPDNFVSRVKILESSIDILFK